MPSTPACHVSLRGQLAHFTRASYQTEITVHKRLSDMSRMQHLNNSHALKKEIHASKFVTSPRLTGASTSMIYENQLKRRKSMTIEYK